jgi:hypothetical protein
MVGAGYRVYITAPTECVATQVMVTALDTMWAEIELALRSGDAVWGPDFDSVKKARQALRK